MQRWRALGGLIGFGLTLLLSLQAGVPAFDAVTRSLVAGIAVHLAAWAIAVTVWRQLMLAELRAMHDRRLERIAAPHRARPRRSRVSQRIDPVGPRTGTQPVNAPLLLTPVEREAERRRREEARKRRKRAAAEQPSETPEQGGRLDVRG